MASFSFRLGSSQSALLCCLAAVLFPLGLTAQDPTQTLAGPNQQPPAPTLSIATREVLLDVVVTDESGKPLTGLTAADFAVSEEGHPQRLSHLEEHHPMTAAEMAPLKAAPALPPNTFTNFTPLVNTNASTVILLDALNAGVQTQMELRQQLIDCLKHLQSGTPVALFQVDIEMRLIQGFTTDPQALFEAAGSKRDMPSMLRPIRGSREEYRRVRTDILRAGFQMMGRYLAGFPGRKSLIWLTGAIPAPYLSDPLGTSFGKSFKDDFTVLDPDPNDLVDALTLSRVAVYPVDARGLQTPPQFQASNRGRPGPYTNMRFESRQAFQHMDLDNMADATGGRAYYNTNGLKQVIASIINNGSNYYTLAYATDNTRWEGQFRRIKVKVDRPGLRVQHRQGYYAVDRTQAEQRLLAAMQRRKARGDYNPFPTEETIPDETAPTEAAQTEAQSAPGAPPTNTGALVHHPKGGFEATMQLGAIPPTEVVFTASLAIDDKVQKLDRKAPLPQDNYLEADYKGKPFRTFVVQINADAHQLRLTRTADGFHHGSVEFVTLVYSPTGTRVNSLISTAELNLSDAHYRQMLATGLPARQEIAVPVKGNYFLRVGVHDVASDHIGALEIPVDEVRPGVFGQGLARQ
jgi:VWFA-related protein